MRGPKHEDIIDTFPPELRDNKSTKAHQDMRVKILTGEYPAHQEIIQRDIEKEYDISNNSAQITLLRLAIEGLIKVLPIRKRKRSNNAAYNEYRVADINIRHRIFSTRQGGFVSDISQTERNAHIKAEPARMVIADSEIRNMLNLPPNANVIFAHSLQKSDQDTIIAISDTYIPAWFSSMMPALEKPDADIYQLMILLGKTPTWCTETIDIVQASSVERKEFGLSPDDPAPLFKIIRRVFDKDGEPLSVDFLTDRGDSYRMHYSFPLFVSDIPEVFRKYQIPENAKDSDNEN